MNLPPEFKPKPIGEFEVKPSRDLEIIITGMIAILNLKATYELQQRERYTALMDYYVMVYEKWFGVKNDMS